MKSIVYTFVLAGLVVLVPVGFLCEFSLAMAALLRRY
jgi:hypothetical protein